MAADRPVLLITDRPHQSRDRGSQLALPGGCRTIGLDDREADVGPVGAIVTDVGFDNPLEIRRLRRVLSGCRSSAMPVLALLRSNTHRARVQALALGATATLDAAASQEEITATLHRLIEAATDGAVQKNAGRTCEVLADAFAAAARDGPVDMGAISVGVQSVASAIADGGIRKWLEVVWTYDDRTYQHCLLVAGLAGEFGAALRFSRHDQDLFVKAALLHDLGKARIPQALLNKQGALTPREAAVMRTHTTIGYEILRRQPDCDPQILDVVLHHHELLDGSGYPDRLAGAAIVDLVRLVTICDIFAALVERRSYKPPFSVPQAFQILQSMQGKLEDSLVLAFTEVVARTMEKRGLAELIGDDSSAHDGRAPENVRRGRTRAKRRSL